MNEEFSLDTLDAAEWILKWFNHDLNMDEEEEENIRSLLKLLRRITLPEIREIMGTEGEGR